MNNGKYNYRYEARSQIPHRGNKRQQSFGSVVLIVLTVIFLCALSAFAGVMLTKKNQLTKIVVIYKQPGQHPSEELRSGTKLSPQALPSAVNSSIAKISPFPSDAENASFDESALVSAVVWSEEGHIVSSYSAVSEMDSVYIKTAGGIYQKAEIIGSDKEYDIAVLQISVAEDQNFSPVILAGADSVIVNETLISVSASFGSASADRSFKGTVQRVDNKMICFDIDIPDFEPLPKGGGMFNLYGELVGIYNDCYDNEFLENGIRAAVSTHILRPVVESIITSGKTLNGDLAQNIFN